MKTKWIRMIGALLAAAICSAAFAQEVKIGVQTGLGYLPLQVMVHEKLLEKNARALGLNGVQAQIVVFSNAGAMNDALLSSSIQYGSGGVSTFLALWAKANGVNEVRSDGALLAMPMYLNTRNPNIKTVRDFSEKDKIGVAGIKVSYQAMLLQMAAAKEFGDANYAQLDPFTVTVSNPDGLIALSNPGGEVNTHFAPPPFAFQEQKLPGVKTVLKSYDILGGPATLNQVWSTVKFSTANPQLHKAFNAALRESIEFINADKHKAAEIYLAMSSDKTPVDDIFAQLKNPEIQYSIVPNRVTVVADFMSKIGTIKKKFTSWRDFYFDDLHGLAGS